MVERREALGLSASSFAEKIGMHYTMYLGYENMKIKPINAKTGQLKETAMKIMIGLNATDQELWPDQILAVEKNSIEKTYDFEEVAALSGGFSHKAALPPSETVSRIEYLRNLISGAKLSDREIRILRKRYELNQTLEEIGREEGVSRDRISQISRRAERKMRYCGEGREGLL
jgi:DNA-directed RNA polymerase sigma subunit (sigma70/sigma32)